MAKRHPWHGCEIRIVHRMKRDGATLADIAAKLERTEGSIKFCLDNLKE